MVLAAILVVAALVLINAVYVAAEFAAVSVRRSRIQHMAAEGNALAAWLLPTLESPASLDRYIAACQIGITLSSLILGAYAQATLAVGVTGLLVARLGVDADRARDAAEVAVLLSLAALQAVVGELIPKSVALQFPAEVALATVLPMRWSLRVFRPFIAAINAATTLILRLVGARLSLQRHVHSPDEIDLLLAESRDGGLLEPEEQQRLHRALRLGRRRVRDLMDHVWTHGPISAEACRKALRATWPMKDSTIRTVLRRLEEKGYVRHTVEGRAFLYRAAERRASVATRAVKHIIDRFCGGSAEELLIGMEFAASLPRAWKVTARQSKKILKDAHRGILPDEILDRRKMGFSVPLKHWLRDDLYGYTRDILLDRSSVGRGYFKRESVERLVEDHRAGRRNNSARLWALLMLEHWHREILDGSSVQPPRTAPQTVP